MKKFIKSLLFLALFATSTSDAYASHKSRSATNSKNSAQTKTTLVAAVNAVANDGQKMIVKIGEPSDGGDPNPLIIPLNYSTNDSGAISKLTETIIKICNSVFKYYGTASGENTNITTPKLSNYLKKYLARKQREQIVITTEKSVKLNTSTTAVENVGSLTHTYSREGTIGGCHCKVYCYARSNAYNILTTAKMKSAQIEITLTVPSNLKSKNSQ